MVESCGDAGARTESGGATDVPGNAREEPNDSGRSKDQRDEAKKGGALRCARRDLPYRVTTRSLKWLPYRAPVSSYRII